MIVLADHTAEWPDGFKVVRICEVGKQMVFEITWRGRRQQLCMGPKSFYVGGKKIKK